MIRTLAAALPALAAPVAALAHGGPEGHGHPHGLEILALGAIAALVWWAARRALR